MRKRLLKDESGFSLPELLVTMLMMLTVMFALYSIFDMSLRVFSFGNDKTEAVENARIGMERMEREIRAAYPYDKADEDNGDGEQLLEEPLESDEITFGNDTNGDRSITDADPDEEITYSLSSDLPSALLRNGAPVVEYVDDISFEYLQSDGTTTASSEEDADIVRVELGIEIPGDPPRTQTLETDVALRNRSE